MSSFSLRLLRRCAWMTPRLFPSLIALFLSSALGAAEDRADRTVQSPDRHFSVVFSDRQTFTIQDTRGAAVISSREFPRLDELTEFRPEYASWSPDSQILAIAGGGGHDLEPLSVQFRPDTFQHLDSHSRIQLLISADRGW